MAATRYRAAPGAQYNEEMAQTLGRVVEKLGGTAKPAQLVDLARPANSTLHSLFEWDDTAAAEKFRLAQARNHLNHLEILIVVDGKDAGTKAVHSVTIESDDEESERLYASIPIIRSNRKLSAQVIANALRELEAWQRRYHEYQTLFAPVTRAVKQVKAKLKPKKKLARAR